jgi:hypothetical protein
MSTARPEQVKDTSVKTKVFDWKVPVEVGGRSGSIRGTLFWTPLPGGGPPLGAVFGLAALIIACSIAVFVVRTRRRVQEEAGEPREAAEAW